ncbi:MAG: LamG domain-containing protein, partial [Bacteroidales bacterium]|nr:LamG domain-containing protein [Bacteroidales bacterium]
MKQFYKIFRTLALSILMLATLSGNTTPVADTIIYVPQINLTASSGFGPYIAGKIQNDLIVTDNLPPETSKVTFCFLDIDGIQVGDGFTKTGTNLDSVSWEVELHSLDLPLSPGLSLELVYGNNSLARYFIPYAVYPDTIEVESTMGFGPFISNNYLFSDTLWQPVPAVYTTFSAKVLPPRTDKVVFYLMDETAAIDSFYVSSLPGMYLDSVSWDNVRIDALPLSTRQLKVVSWCHGGPDAGISVEKNLSMEIQTPFLACYSNGLLYQDSIPSAIQNQTDGHVLLVDSTKNMTVTNMPGGNSFLDRLGSYSFMMYRPWSFESWIRFDMEKITSGAEGRMTFMKVDSAWEIVVENKPEVDSLKFILNCPIQAGYDIAHAQISYSQLQEKEWHHIAFTSNLPVYIKRFYFDGNLLDTYVNIEHLDYLGSHAYEYLSLLGTKPLIFGGCNAGVRRRSDDLSLITAMDEIRMWKVTLSGDYIKNNFSRPTLQSENLTGYWNFNDLNCNGVNVADLSYQCNNGTLMNGALLIGQFPGVQFIMDTLVFHSSHALTDSVKFDFIDKSNIVSDSFTLFSENGKFTVFYDIEALPYTTNLLRTTEYFPGTDGGYSTIYDVIIYPPLPVATIRTGWGNYYASS